MSAAVVFQRTNHVLVVPNPQVWGENVCSDYQIPISCQPPPAPTPSPSPSPSPTPAPPPPACATSYMGSDAQTCTKTFSLVGLDCSTLLVSIVISGNDYPGLTFAAPIASTE